MLNMIWNKPIILNNLKNKYYSLNVQRFCHAAVYGGNKFVSNNTSG